MSKVKICGVRRIEDINYVNKYLPEYIGFIFADSKRRVTVEQAKILAAALDARVRKVGVFVNAELEEIIASVCVCGLDVIQLHGDETPEYLKNLKCKLECGLLNSNKKNSEIEIWKAIRVENKECVESLKHYNADTFVLDAYVQGVYGGAGKTFDWDLALEAKKYGKIVLAGGLQAENVLTASRKIQPYAVDVSSGVEIEGYKNEKKIRTFINMVRGYD